MTRVLPPASHRKIPATVITGFLGAGKTSLIRHLLETSHGSRLALVINEFGEVGVDRDVLLGCGLESCGDEDVVELANGCICCTVADDFLPTMRMLLDRPDPPDHIVIETSGLALPKPLVKAFAWPEVRDPRPPLTVSSRWSMPPRWPMADSPPTPGRCRPSAAPTRRSTITVLSRNCSRNRCSAPT